MTEGEGYIAVTLISIVLVSIIVFVPKLIKFIFQAGIALLDDIVDFFFDND